MQIGFGQAFSPIRNNVIQPKKSQVPFAGEIPQDTFFSVKNKLFKPFPIDDRYIATEFKAEDEARLLEIAHKEGFVYSGLNAYEGMPIEENVHAYLHNEALLAQRENPRRTLYAAIRDTQEGGRLVGAIEAMGGEQSQDGEAELAYFIDPDYQGKSLVTRAACAVIPRMVQMGIKPYWSEAAPDNIASQRVLEKLGYERVEEPVGKGGIIGADGELRSYTGDRIGYKTNEKALLQRIAELSKGFPPKTAKID